MSTVVYAFVYTSRSVASEREVLGTEGGKNVGVKTIRFCMLTNDLWVWHAMYVYVETARYRKRPRARKQCSKKYLKKL